MRTRRDPKPPRPPRPPCVITPRLIVIALVVGVVLAVVSVPVCVAVDRTPWMKNRWRETNTDYKFQGRLVSIQWEHYPTGGLLMCSGVDAELVQRQYVSDEVRNAPAVSHDPRPRFTRKWLDRGDGMVFSPRFGWPWAAGWSVSYEQFSQTNGSPSGAAPVEVGAWNVIAFGHDLSIPYLPLWPGLLGNTLFYAVLVLAPLALLRWRKLRRRARRGLCVACGYELGAGVEACPECGLAKRGP